MRRAAVGEDRAVVFVDDVKMVRGKTEAGPRRASNGSENRALNRIWGHLIEGEDLGAHFGRSEQDTANDQIRKGNPRL